MLMNTEGMLLRNLIDEYAGIVADMKASTASDDGSEWDEVAKRLQIDAEWSKEGSQHVVDLVHGYGVFVLRNALALAIAADIQDGALNL